MKVNIKEEPAWRRVLEIEVDAAVVDRELDHVVDEYRKRLSIPGFRKGRAPRKLIIKRFGDVINADVKEKLVQEAYTEALEQKKLEPAGEPQAPQSEGTLPCVACLLRCEPCRRSRC